jgi:RNA polymerase sigma-70 factor (ECF subfamily)
MAERSGKHKSKQQGRPRGPVALDGDDEVVLITNAQQGDQDALAELLNRHSDSIYLTCYRMLGNSDRARDLAQDSMVRLIEALHTFDGRAKFNTWMTRVVMNQCITHLRRERLRRHASLNVSAGSEDGEGVEGWTRIEQGTEPEPDVGVQKGEMLHRLRQAMGRLDADARSILVLRDVRGFDYAQIGEVLEIPVGTVKSRIFRARAALRELMESLADSRDNTAGQEKTA